MARRPKTSTAMPAGFALGKDIDLSSWNDNQIAIDDGDRVHYFVGYRRESQPDGLPYYSPSVGLRDLAGRKSYRFVKLSRGTLTMAGFLHDDRYYRVLTDRWVVFPSGSDSYFGVISRNDRREDAALTREIFGGTFQEIEHVATSLGIISGRNHQMLRLPRLTFSKTRDNSCDVTGCLIPRQFPYIAFEDAQYDWSHVSIHGFYRLLSFLCPSDRSPVWRALIDAGVTEDVLKRFASNADGNAHPLQRGKHF